MNYLVNKLKSMYRTTIVLSILLIFIGVFLLIKPETTLHAISYIIGTALIIWGLFPIISFFTNKESQNYLEFSFVIGIFAFLFGLVVIIDPELIGSIIPLLMGIWMIINGAIKLYYSFILNREKYSIIPIVVSLIILLCGLVLVINPFDGAIVLTQLIGISFIVYSVLDLIECFSIYKTYNSVKKDADSTQDDNDKTVKIINADYKEKDNKRKKK